MAVTRGVSGPREVPGAALRLVLFLCKGDHQEQGVLPSLEFPSLFSYLA